MPANYLVKLTVLASSLLLGAAFVSYRAGAFDWSSRSDSATIETPPIPPHPTVVVPPRTQVAPPAASVPEQQIFYGSKSGAVFVEPQPTPQPAQAPTPQQTANSAPQSAVIMSGSKSLMPAPRQEAVKALQQQAGRR